MRKLQGAGLAGLAVTGLMCVSGVASAAPAVSSAKLTGYTIAEAHVSVAAHAQASAEATCPSGDVVVGGGAYETVQKLGQDLNSSYPDSDGTGWIATFNDTKAYGNTGTAVAVCVAASSVANYSVQDGSLVNVAAGSQTQATVLCPSGTVSLGGGGNMQTAGTKTFDSLSASAPFGTGGWRAYLGSAGAKGTSGQAAAVCATEPAGWAQVASSYVTNPADHATTVTVHCPAATKVLAGGPFNSSSDPTVSIGLTTSVSTLKAWHSKENNDSGASESVDEWAVCAQVAAS